MINLLPTEVKEDFSYGRKNSQILRWIVTVIFGIVILLIVAAVGRLNIQTARNQAVLQKELMEQQLVDSDFETIDGKYSEFVDGLDNAKKLYQRQILYSRLIRKLGTVLPPGAKLTNISISDQDRAIGLNFDNDADGLGPTIQLNLTDQSKQIIEKTQATFNESLRIPVSDQSAIITDPINKTIRFAVKVENKEFEDRLKTAVQNGGELAFATMYDSLNSPENRHLIDFKSIRAAMDTSGGVIDESSKTFVSAIADNEFTSRAQIRSYTVDNDQKYVDFKVRADNLAEAKAIENVLTGSKNSMFIETYTFEDKDYRTKERCTDTYSGKATCDSGANTCTPVSRNGCQFTVRAYYDELYKKATLSEASEAESKKCRDSGKICTHYVEATYSQLFSKVDINRVATCTKDATNGISTCAVEMRAEFSLDSKFYLINPTGASL